jgi:cytochrome c peroxidase
MKKNKFALILTFMSFFLSHWSMANEAILKELEKEARSADAKFVQFNITAGEKFFRNERINSSGEKVSCMTCHTPDPKKTGMTRANKVIEPMAPTINTERFTDIIKVQKWFKRNCNDVLERICTSQEKGNFVKYMMSIK